MTKQEFESITSQYDGASFSNLEALNANIGYIQSCDGGVFNISGKKDDIPRIVGYHDQSSSLVILDYYYEGTLRTNQKMRVYLTLGNIQAIGMLDKGFFKPEHFDKETLSNEYNMYKY